MASESEPFTRAPVQAQWNTTEYDLYGRTIRLTAFTGKVSTITYSGLTTTVNDGTKTVATTKNAMGNVTRVQDPRRGDHLYLLWQRGHEDRRL